MKTNSKLYPWQLAQIRRAWVANLTLPFVISAAMWGVVIDWIDAYERRSQSSPSEVREP